jgi:hypothetical protein
MRNLFARSNRRICIPTVLLSIEGCDGNKCLEFQKAGTRIRRLRVETSLWATVASAKVAGQFRSLTILC